MPSPNTKCPRDCGGRLRSVWRNLFRCKQCHELHEQSPSGGWRDVCHAMGVGDGR